jgi:hypothetical protein
MATDGNRAREALTVGILPCGPADGQLRLSETAGPCLFRAPRARGFGHPLLDVPRPFTAQEQVVPGGLEFQCLDHVIIVNAAGLRRVLNAYVATTRRRARIWRSKRTRPCRARLRHPPPDASSRSPRSAVSIIATNDARRTLATGNQSTRWTNRGQRIAHGHPARDGCPVIAPAKHATDRPLITSNRQGVPVRDWSPPPADVIFNRHNWLAAIAGDTAPARTPLEKVIRHRPRP